jgi:RsiW-degrading membrane proteinase PrsW (M82 family)
VSGPGPALARTTERNIRMQSRSLRVAAVIVLVLAGLVTLLLIGVLVGPVALLTGLVLAAVPAPIYLFLALRVDRFEPEPLRLLLGTFFWGGTAATLIAIILNTAGQAIVGAEFGADVGEIYGGSVSAPVVEESAKAGVLFALYRWSRHHIDGVLDGLVYAAMVGLGFATTENVLYYSRAAVEGGVPLAATFFMRGVLSPFAHPVFTAMTGIGIGLAVTTTKGWLRVAAPAGGLLAAMALHSLWNTSATVEGGIAFVGVYFLIMVPIFVALVVVAIVARRREGGIVAQELQPEAAAGVLSPADVELLSSVRDRRRLEKAARRDSPAARQAARTLQLAATGLAFQRHRARRGLPPAAGSDPQRDEAAFRSALQALQANLGPAVQQLRQQAQARLDWRRGPAAAAGATGHWPAGSPAPAGWYADPWGQSRWRWYDGRAWTGYVWL